MNDAGAVSSPDGSIDAGADGAVDAATGRDAGPPTCAASCPFHACAGTACAVTPVAKTGSGPWDLAVVSNAVYFTDGTSIRECTAPPCNTAGTPLVYSAAGHSYLAIATGRVASADYLVVSDNSYTQGILRSDLAGMSDKWASASNNASALSISGNTIVFGDQSGVYRAAMDTSGATKVMSVSPAFFTGSGMPCPPLHNVAVDPTAMFAASTGDVYRCGVADTCTATASAAGTTAMPNVVALAVHAGTLYALGGTPFVVDGTERIWSVPVAGGDVTDVASTTPPLNGGGFPFGLLADDAHLYWGSLDGNIYTCSTVGPCAPQALVTGARPFTMSQDAAAVYWISRAGTEIYRVQKP